MILKINQIFQNSKNQKIQSKQNIKRGQGSSVNKLGATSQRQGGTIRDGVRCSFGGPAVKVTNYKDIRQKRLDAREAARQAKRVTPAVKATGIPTGKNLKAGSFGISKEGRDQAAINRGDTNASVENRYSYKKQYKVVQ